MYLAICPYFFYGCVILPLETLPHPRRSEWGSNLPPDCFVSRGSISTWVILNIRFFGVGLLALRPTPKLEDHPLSAVRGCLFNLFTATLHIGGRSSIRNLRTRLAVVTGTHIHHLLPPMGRKACTEPQCLYKGALYLLPLRMLLCVLYWFLGV
jgi:hypothetical protein